MSRCTDNYASDQSSSVFTLSFLLRCFLPFLANFWVRVELTEHAHWWRIPCTRVWDFKTLDHNGKVPTARWLHTRIRDLLKKESESASHSVLSDSLQPHGLLPTRLLCPWDFSRQEYWSGLPFPTLGDLPYLGMETESSALAGEFFTTKPLGKPHYVGIIG